MKGEWEGEGEGRDREWEDRKLPLSIEAIIHQLSRPAQDPSAPPGYLGNWATLVPVFPSPPPSPAQDRNNPAHSHFHLSSSCFLPQVPCLTHRGSLPSTPGVPSFTPPRLCPRDPRFPLGKSLQVGQKQPCYCPAFPRCHTDQSHLTHPTQHTHSHRSQNNCFLSDTAVLVHRLMRGRARDNRS